MPPIHQINLTNVTKPERGAPRAGEQEDGSGESACAALVGFCTGTSVSLTLTVCPTVLAWQATDPEPCKDGRPFRHAFFAHRAPITCFVNGANRVLRNEATNRGKEKEREQRVCVCVRSCVDGERHGLRAMSTKMIKCNLPHAS